MKNFYYLLSIVLIVTFVSCSSVKTIDIINSELSMMESIDSTRIIILPFEKLGAGLPPYTSELVAEKLSTKLLASQKFFVIESKKVKESIELNDISDKDQMNFSELKLIGKELKADYILIGKILKYSDNNSSFSTTENKVDISFKVISTKTNEIVGVASLKCIYKKYNIIDVIDYIVDEVTEILIEKEKNRDLLIGKSIDNNDTLDDETNEDITNDD